MKGRRGLEILVLAFGVLFLAAVVTVFAVLAKNLVRSHLGRAWMAKGDIEKGKKFIEKHRETADRYTVRKPGLLRDLTEGLVLWLAFQV